MVSCRCAFSILEKEQNTLDMKLIKIAMIGICALAISCSKNEPTPAAVTNNNTNNNNNTDNTGTHNQSLCDGSVDSICTFPFYIMPYFVPSGYYQYSENTVIFGLDDAETPEFENQNIRIVYTWNNGYWGASFLNDNRWDAAIKMKPGATKLSLYARINYSANVTFNAFSNSAVGKKELYKKSSPVATPVWELVEIPLTNPPASFNTPLGIIIDGYTGTNGDVITVDLKDIKIE
jgi:hypothetical protein